MTASKCFEALYRIDLLIEIYILTTSLHCVCTLYVPICRMSHALCTYAVHAQCSKFCFATLKISFVFKG